MKYQPTIGLEIHAEINTQTKMFCDCPSSAGASAGKPNSSLEAEPNTNVCPVCLAHPGTLPVPNKAAIESVIRVGLALGGKINPVSKFDRKNYFYPDLPKGYQISQYDQPLVVGGMLNGVHIRRIHLEEDTGRLVHASSVKEQASSLVDFNRAGVPLMELVTEPDIRSAEEVAAFARELQLILRYLGVSDAEMENGQMRVEANVSLNMGTYVELKNINSLRAVSDAVIYEIERQGGVLEKGEKVAKETRGWDEGKRKTVSQRSKEEAHDYRYFPEPDIPPFETALFEPERLKLELPELPKDKRERFSAEFNLNPSQADLLVGEPLLASFFEDSMSELAERSPGVTPELLYNYLTSDLRGLLLEAGESLAGCKVTPERLAHLVSLIHDGTIMSRQAKDILKKIFETGDDPEDILKAENLGTVSDENELGKLVLEVIAENPNAAVDYKNGKAASLQFMLGAAMKKLRGRGNPEVLKRIFIDELQT
jgi:aspartyl-tRNA(Asn)/glutamyl-tRNA(Gln) amidotransferase subunit B